MGLTRKPKRVFSPEENLYQSYETEDDARRSAVHYELPIEFFFKILGGEWQIYSCCLWPDPGASLTEAQEAKLDLLAGLMELKPGQRIMDVGCGWGGPLVYLCKKYGVRGVGLTVSPLQKQAADERIARHGADAEILLTHWREYRDECPFDAIYSDEVIVHFNDLGGFFKMAHGLLRDGGRMVNKELHFTHSTYAQMTRGMSFINEIFAGTGNYRTLADELALTNEAGFEVQRIVQIHLPHYHRTVEHWLDSMAAHRDELVALVGPKTYRDYRIWFKIVRRVHGMSTMTLDVVQARKMSG